MVNGKIAFQRNFFETGFETNWHTPGKNYTSFAENRIALFGEKNAINANANTSSEPFPTKTFSFWTFS